MGIKNVMTLRDFAASITIGPFGTATILELLYTFAYQMDKETADPP
jgi:hypothetical protein